MTDPASAPGPRPSPTVGAGAVCVVVLAVAGLVFGRPDAVALAVPLALCVLSEAGRKEPREQLEGSLKRLLEETNQALDKHEKLNGLVLVPEVWAVENGFLTPTLKIKRASVEGAYSPHFQAWGSRSGEVVWQE